MLLLDTHVLLWHRTGSTRLGRQTDELIHGFWQLNRVYISAISIWEISILLWKGRIKLEKELDVWYRELIEQGIQEIPVDGKIAIRSYSLENFHSDPADRMLVATALDGYQLATADHLILDWSGKLDRVNAAV